MSKTIFGGLGNSISGLFRLAPKSFMLAGSFLLVLIIAALVVAFRNPATNEPVLVSSAKPDELKNEAYAKAYEGRFEESFDAFDTAASAAGTDKEKENIYLDKINIALNEKYYEEAIETGNKLLKVRETGTFYGLLARAYEGSGDKGRALEYYEKAASYQSGNTNSNASSNTYRAKVNELKAAR